MSDDVVKIPSPRTTVEAKRWPVQLDPENPKHVVYLRRLPIDLAEGFCQKVLDLFVNAHVRGEHIVSAFFGGSAYQDLLSFVVGPMVSVGEARKLVTDLLTTKSKSGKHILVWEDGTPVTQEEIEDADLFPLSAIPTLFLALWNHPDLIYFLSQGRSLWRMVIAQNPLIAQVAEKIRATYSGTASGIDQNPSVTEDGGSEATTSSGTVTD